MPRLNSIWKQKVFFLLKIKIKIFIFSLSGKFAQIRKIPLGRLVRKTLVLLPSFQSLRQRLQRLFFLVESGPHYSLEATLDWKHHQQQSVETWRIRWVLNRENFNFRCQKGSNWKKKKRYFWLCLPSIAFHSF